MHDTHRAAVAGFYETHPINEDEILQKLSGRGLDLGRLTEQELKDFDQDHYGGVEAVEALAEAAEISEGQHVLDVGSGMGGPARWLAHSFGCHVTGLDLTDSRVLGARRLTERVGLSGLVKFVQGDATRMPFPMSNFDAPNADAACARRVRSNTPLAALTGLNEPIFVEAARFKVVLGFLLPLVAFAAVSTFLGLYVGTALYIAATMSLQGGYKWWIGVLAGVGVALFFFVIFEIGFKVPLLKGPVEAFFGIY